MSNIAQFIKHQVITHLIIQDLAEVKNTTGESLEKVYFLSFFFCSLHAACVTDCTKAFPL